MPRTLQHDEDKNALANEDHAPLQGLQPQVEKKKRRRFTIQEKLCFIRNVRKRLENGLSQRAACEELNIHHTLALRLVDKTNGGNETIKEFQGKESLPRSSVLACTNTRGASSLYL